MADPTTPKSEDGRGIPPAGEQKTVETRAGDSRLFPGGSPAAARLHVGVNALDQDPAKPAS